MLDDNGNRSNGMCKWIGSQYRDITSQKNDVKRIPKIDGHLSVTPRDADGCGILSFFVIIKKCFG